MSTEGAPTGPAWAALIAATPARIGLGRTGASLPTREVLRFGLAHAAARDAVQVPLEPDSLADELAGLGLETLLVASAATGRDMYLRRPDFGRMLSPDSRALIEGRPRGTELALVIGDGLSSTAVHRHAADFVATLLPYLGRTRLALGPVVLARQARVALGDDIAEALGARAVIVLIGERPGLSAPDGLGLYFTYAPRRGLTDASRNCISNIRPDGLPFERAAFTVGWLLGEAFRRELSGVGLKDESGVALAGAVLRRRNSEALRSEEPGIHAHRSKPGT